MRRLTHFLAVALTGVAAGMPLSASAADGPLAPYVIVGDAIPEPLDGRAGDTQRGRKLVLDRETGNCLICHQIPVTGEPSQGDLAPALGDVGRRLTVGQLRFRLVDQSRLNPATSMPPYYRVDRLTRVAARFRDKPVFTAQEIEDVVVWLATLKE